MRRTHALLGGAAGLLAVAAAYTTLDVHDVVPGVLTQAGSRPRAVPEPGRSAPPSPAVAAPAPQRIPAVPDAGAAPRPVPARVDQALARPLASAALPERVALTVRDARTGAVVVDHGGTQPVTPASVTKLVTAWAVAHTLDLRATLPTTVVAGGPGHVVLVAGGDMMLAPGAGDPAAVPGRAGLGDLADQVAAALTRAGRSEVTLDVDLTHAPGDSKIATWGEDLLDLGFATRVTMLGLATERSDPGHAAAQNPVRDVTTALADRLRAKGIDVTLGDRRTAPAGATRLGQVRSAPVVDLLGQGLLDSDNALIENLARQAAYSRHVPSDEKSVTAWIERTVRAGGFDLTGVHLADASGLSDGTTLTTDLLARLLLSATSGADPAYAAAVARLPTSGLDGTLDDRFLGPGGRRAAGYVRAKTGSLPDVSSLAGTVVDADGRALVFAIVADGAQPAGRDATRAAIDDVVAALGDCGCR